MSDNAINTQELQEIAGRLFTSHTQAAVMKPKGESEAEVAKWVKYVKNARFEFLAHVVLAVYQNGRTEEELDEAFQAIRDCVEGRRLKPHECHHVGKFLKKRVEVPA